jgi:serine/threonine-protein kinase RIO1
MSNFIIYIPLIILLRSLSSGGKITDYNTCIGEIRNAQINLVKAPQMKIQKERTTRKCEGNKTASEKFVIKLYNIFV